MLYIKIGNRKYAAKIQNFTTQRGKNGIRVISDEAPTAHSGFLVVDNDGNVISDRSAYTYLYREDDTCKEYTMVAERIIPTRCFEMGDVPASAVSRQISNLNARVSAITPYVESKVAYIDDEEVRFSIGKEGNITVFMTDEDCRNVPFEYDVENGEIVVRFEKRESLATVTISIQ